MKTILSNGWSTGPLLLENTGVCVLQSSLQDSYNASQLQQYLERSFPVLQSGTDEPNPCDNGSPPKGVFIEAIDQGRLKLKHANDTLYLYNLTLYLDNLESVTSELGAIISVDFNCTSQLNLTILEDWASVWYKHRHLI